MTRVCSAAHGLVKIFLFCIQEAREFEFYEFCGPLQTDRLEHKQNTSQYDICVLEFYLSLLFLQTNSGPDK